jgi:hypothetical protein
MLDTQNHSAMHGLRFANDVNGNRAGRVGPRPSNVYLSKMQKGSAAPNGQYRDRSLGRAATHHQSRQRRHSRCSRRSNDSETCKITRLVWRKIKSFPYSLPTGSGHPQPTI